MSGFDCGEYEGQAVFDLTATKAGYWHRDQTGCRHAATPAAIVRAHAVPAGFEIIYEGSGYVHVIGPGLNEGKTRELYAAISGRDLADVADR